MTRDRVFAAKRRQIQPFSFNREVAAVFDDMLIRSVPLYRESLHRQVGLVMRFYRAGTWIYDLGCSHGNLGVKLQAAFKKPISPWWVWTPPNPCWKNTGTGFDRQNRATAFIWSAAPWKISGFPMPRWW